MNENESLRDVGIPGMCIRKVAVNDKIKRGKDLKEQRV